MNKLVHQLTNLLNHLFLSTL